MGREAMSSKRNSGASTITENSSDFSAALFEEFTPGYFSKDVFFTEVNPDAACATLFETHLAEEAGEQTLIKTHPQEGRIAKEIAKYMQDSIKTFYNRTSKKRYYRVSPLAAPKGSPIPLCEVCLGVAVLACSKCTVTFYCSMEHYRSDKLHPSICERLKMIRWPTPLRFTNTERRRLDAQKLLIMERMLDDLYKQAYACLFGGSYKNAVTSLLQCLHYIEPVYGTANQLVPMIMCLTTLAHAQLGTGDIAGAEVSINKANLRMVKLDDMDPKSDFNITRSLIHRVAGLLAYAKKDYEAAIAQLSNNIFLITEEYGTTTLRVVVGYYYMARCFRDSDRNLVALSMISHAIDIVLDVLFDFISTAIPDPLVWNMSWNRSKQMCAFYEIETMEMLRGALTMIDEEDYEKEGRVIVCEAMLLFLRNFNSDCKKQLNYLPQVYEFDRNPRVMRMIKHVRNAILTEENSGTNLLKSTDLIQPPWPKSPSMVTR